MNQSFVILCVNGTNCYSNFNPCRKFSEINKGPKSISSKFLAQIARGVILGKPAELLILEKQNI